MSSKTKIEQLVESGTGTILSYHKHKKRNDKNFAVLVKHDDGTVQTFSTVSKDLLDRLLQQTATPGVEKRKTRKNGHSSLLEQGENNRLLTNNRCQIWSFKD